MYKTEVALTRQTQAITIFFKSITNSPYIQTIPFESANTCKASNDSLPLHFSSNGCILSRSIAYHANQHLSKQSTMSITRTEHRSKAHLPFTFFKSSSPVGSSAKSFLSAAHGSFIGFLPRVHSGRRYTRTCLLAPIMMAQRSILNEDIEFTHPGGQECASGLGFLHMCSRCSCGVRTNIEGPLPMVL